MYDTIQKLNLSSSLNQSTKSIQNTSRLHQITLNSDLVSSIRTRSFVAIPTQNGDYFRKFNFQIFKQQAPSMEFLQATSTTKVPK